MARLPIPGQDNNTWGDILNDFLLAEHNTDGSLKLASIVAQKYQLPAGGIPKSDMASDVQSSLAKADSSGSDATTSAKGVIQLGGDLAGTATSPTVKSRSFSVTVGPASSVADYICTGVSDDVQIQAAINAVASAGGGVVFVRRGTYRISATITFPLNANVSIIGEKWAKQGSGGVIFKTSAGVNLTDMFIINGNSNPITNADLSHDSSFFHVTFDGNNTTTNLLTLTNTDTIKLERVRMVGAVNSIHTVWDSTSDPIVATVPGAIFLRDSIISANGGIGIDLQYQTQCWISDCWFSGNSVAAWINLQSCNKIHISNCEFDSAAISIVLLDTATVATNDITVQSCTFVQSSGTAWTDSRTNAASDRVHITGTILPGITHDKLAGTHNTVWLSDGLQPVTIQSQAASDTPLILKGVSSQSGRYMQVQNSGGTQLMFINNTGAIFVANGSTTTPGLGFANDVGSGFYRVAASTIGMTINGTQVLRFDNSGIVVNRITTAQKNALTPTNGAIIYDTDLNKFQGYENGSWANLI